MTYVYAPDGVTITNAPGTSRSRFAELPKKHWEQTQVDPPQGTVHDLTPANAASFGYHEVTIVGTDQGDGWVLPSDPVNEGPGVFTRTWAFDQATADAIADQADRDADAAALRDDLQNAKDVRAAAVQSRTEMDHETPDPAALAKWAPVAEDVLAPVDRVGNQASQITALQDRVDELTLRQRDSARLANDLRIEMRRMYGDIRLTAAMLVRKFRKDRDDV